MPLCRHPEVQTQWFAPVVVQLPQLECLYKPTMSFFCTERSTEEVNSVSLVGV